MPEPVAGAEGLTIRLASQLTELAGQPLPPRIQRAGERSLLNVLGTAIGAARHPAVGIVVDVLGAHGGEPRHRPPGRHERLDAPSACTAIGLAAHVDDFDDTHLATVIHPAAAVLGPILTLGAERQVTGRHALRAAVLGIETQLRIGLAVSPWHYDDGWHITGTCGVLGAAVTAGVLLDLPADRLANALGTAASQTLGQRESFGTMVKGFHPGKAAANGVLAALLAEQGFTGPTDVLEAPRGFLRVLSPSGTESGQILGGLGERWEIEANTFKPYPCGIVSHPSIDAAIALATRLPGSRAIEHVEARVHPLVLDLAGEHTPRDGLAARFSTAHGIAAGLLDGQVDRSTYSDDRVVHAPTAGLRAKIHLVASDDVARDAATVTVTLAGGGQLTERIEHARGSLARPLTQEELEDKVRGLVEPVLPGRTSDLCRLVAELEATPTLEPLLSTLAPTMEPTA